MNRSRATVVGKHVVRGKARIWVTPKGQVVTEEVTAPAEAAPAPTSKKVEWDAHVVDSETNAVVEAYPSLTGLDELSLDENEAKRQLVTIYLDRLRFLDKKVDVNALKDKVNAGVWDIHTEVKSVPSIN